MRVSLSDRHWHTASIKNIATNDGYGKADYSFPHIEAIFTILLPLLAIMLVAMA
jgi:hypothetical protein